MNFMRADVLVAGIGMLVVMGCESHRQFPDSSLTGGVSEVKIGESVMAPMVVTAKRGDEVRWINASNGPVEVSVVQTREELISCQKGFASTDLGYLMGTSEYENIVMATVPQNEFASLCFAQPGKYAYSVRKDPSMTGKGSTEKSSGSVIVE
jgi:plastocyanin